MAPARAKWATGNHLIVIRVRPRRSAAGSLWNHPRSRPFCHASAAGDQVSMKRRMRRLYPSCSGRADTGCPNRISRTAPPAQRGTTLWLFSPLPTPRQRRSPRRRRFPTQNRCANQIRRGCRTRNPFPIRMRTTCLPSTRVRSVQGHEAISVRDIIDEADLGRSADWPHVGRSRRPAL